MGSGGTGEMKPFRVNHPRPTRDKVSTFTPLTLALKTGEKVRPPEQCP